MPPLAAILIYAITAAAQWQGHGSRARHAALDAALTAYPEIHARETEKLKNGDPSARFVLARVTNGLGNRNYGIIASFALALYQRAALYVHWPEQHCDGFADAEGVECAAATLESLFADPGIAWTSVRPFGNHGGRDGGSTRVHYEDYPQEAGRAEVLIDLRSDHDELTQRPVRGAFTISARRALFDLHIGCTPRTSRAGATSSCTATTFYCRLSCAMQGSLRQACFRQTTSRPRPRSSGGS